MNTTEINLNFNKADFEEVYFKNRENNMLFSKLIKKQFMLSLIFGTLSLASLIYPRLCSRAIRLDLMAVLPH